LSESESFAGIKPSPFVSGRPRCQILEGVCKTVAIGINVIIAGILGHFLPIAAGEEFVTVSTAAAIRIGTQGVAVLLEPSWRHPRD